jgi:asparagine synthase (glutamine-hydrolysing)
LTIDIQDFFTQLRALTSHKEVSIKDFKGLLTQLKGHFSFVFFWNDNVFASVDRVCSIPVYYLENELQIAVSNNATLLKEFASLDVKSLLRSSVIEIAMSGYTIGDKTLYRGLNQLTAGECLLVRQNRLEKYFYYTYSPWRVNNCSKHHLKTQLTDCLVETFTDLIESVEGRQIVVPLSAGNDSRLVASGLKHLGYKNVVCFSYGSYNHFESRTSRTIAEKLGYPWVHVPLTRKSQKTFFKSRIFEDYCIKTDSLASTIYLQDVSAVAYLKDNNLISKDAVFVNGNTGDFISGGHVPKSLKEESLSPDDFIKVFDSSWDDFLDKHFTLWGVLRSEKNDSNIKDNLNALLLQRETPDIQNVEQIHGFFECLEYLGRQSKYIVNMQRSYDYHGFSWRIPLWSDQMLGFWEGVPRVYKINQNLYKDVLRENNWGGVWRDLPVNPGEINSKSLRFARMISKAIFFPFGKDVWHAFERRVFQYFLDDTAHSSIVPYRKVLLDKRRHRHWVSWLTESYLNNKGFDKISKNFPDEI